MQLTLDLTPMLLRSAGVKNHLYYWTRALLAGRGAHEVRLFPYLKELGALYHDSGVERGIPDWRLFLVAGFNWPLTHALVRRLIPRAEVFHGSPQMRERPRCARMTSHIHDLTPWLMPEMHLEANVRAAHQTAQRVWKGAEGLIAVSASAKEDAVRVLGLDPERIRVIHHGVPEAFFHVDAEAIARTRNRYGLERGYALVVGTVEPRKNVDRLLDGWLALPEDVQNDFELVVAGPAGWKSEATLARLRGQGRGVRYFGYVQEADLPGLTAGATALLYPSLYEGFGFPIAQAMAAGVASVTSGISSMPEIAAGSALLVDPRSTGEIRDAILRLLTSRDLAGRLGRLGREHALTHYRWEISAQRSWEFFESVCS